VSEVVATRFCRADELPEGRATSRQLGERPVAVVRLAGMLHAFGALCPHQFADLSEGIFEDGGVSCPSHLWRFELTTGRCVSIPGAAVPIYGVREEDGWILVELPA